jgi:hypothetical protein
VTRNDRVALKLAIEHARALEPERARQIDAKLADPDETWEDVATFASYVCQCENLQLLPHERPPAWIEDADNPDAGLRPYRSSPDGRYEAAALIKKMAALGISKWHPDR